MAEFGSADNPIFPFVPLFFSLMTWENCHRFNFNIICF